MHTTQTIKAIAATLTLCCGLLLGGIPQAQATTVTGTDSYISVQVPEKLSEDTTFFTIPKNMKKFVRGEQFNKMESNNLDVTIYMLSLQAKEFEAATSQTVDAALEKSVAEYEGKLLKSQSATGSKIVRTTMTISGKQIPVDTVSFRSGGQEMEMKALPFLNKDDFWIITQIYQPKKPASAQAADDFMKTLTIY